MCKLLYNLYKINNFRIRNFVIKVIRKLEGGEFYSKTLRDIFKDYHNIEIGMYTHGGCFVPHQISPFTTFGRYCSIAMDIRIINRNHPVEFKSTHAFFCISQFGLCDKDLVEYIPLLVGNDVWIGHNAIILPHTKTIGDGAVIAAGAVVNKDVPPYAVIVGNPARIVRYRFSKEVINEFLVSKWWEKSLDEIKTHVREFQTPYKSEID